MATHSEPRRAVVVDSLRDFGFNVDAEYKPIIDRFTGSRVRGYFQQSNQLILSLQEGPAWPDRGNSFWICRLAESWYACTWSPRYYRVPNIAQLLDFCEEFVFFGDKAQFEIPRSFVERYNLVEIEDAAFDVLWKASGPSE